MSHWYDTEGNPQYTIIGKNGKERETNLRDARTLHYVPSVTTVTNVLDKTGLLKYFLKNIVAAVISEDRQKEGEEFEDYVDRLYAVAKQESQIAAQRGTYLHGLLEEYFKDSGLVGLKEDQDFIELIVDEVYKISDPNEVNWIPERSFSHPLGYGGKIDLISTDGNGVVIDFKSKNTTDKKKFYKYDEHLMQLAAYRHGLNLPKARCIDIYFSSIESGIIEVHEWKEEELEKGWEMFQALLRFWQTSNNYDSSFTNYVPGVCQ